MKNIFAGLILAFTISNFHYTLYAQAGQVQANGITIADFEIVKGMGHDLPAPLINTLVDLILKMQ